MKNFADTKFTLLNYMCDIAFNFYEKNNLEHLCVRESQLVGNYNTEEQLKWLQRFSDVWDRVEEREVNK